MMLSCPHCGGQLQATSSTYWTQADGQWVPEDFSDWEMKFYCENDCSLGQVDIDHDTYVDLANAVQRLALLNARDTATTMKLHGMGGGDENDPEYLDRICEHMPHVIHVHDAPHPDGPTPVFIGPVLPNDADVVEFLDRFGHRAHLDPLWALDFIREKLEEQEAAQ